jgi:hypothetical protein
LSLTIPEGNLWQAKRMFDLPEGRPLEPSWPIPFWMKLFFSNIWKRR